MSGAERCVNPSCPDYGFIHEGSCGIKSPGSDSPAAQLILARAKPPAPGQALTADQSIRLSALELTVEHYRGSLLQGRWLAPEDLIARASKLESYVRDGKSA